MAWPRRLPPQSLKGQELLASHGVLALTKDAGVLLPKFY